MMKTRLRSLERRLTRERATLAVRDFVERVSLVWDDLLDQPDSSFVIITLLQDNWDRGIGLPTLAAAANYLENRLRNGERLNERALTAIMAPWSVRKLDRWK